MTVRGQRDRKSLVGILFRERYDPAMLDRIVGEPAICDGKATGRGLRINVDSSFEASRRRLTAPEHIVREYAVLQPDDVYQAAKYGA